MVFYPAWASIAGSAKTTVIAIVFLCAVVLIVGVVAQKLSNGPTEPFHRGDLGIAKARLGRVV